MNQTLPISDMVQATLTPKVAVSYLRVSTRGQAERGGGDTEGFSIPAQRDANRHKAASLGAIVVREFVDRGASAKSADRPELKNMLGYVADHNVDYVIVHKVDRLARNRADDVEISRLIEKAGVRLVSTTESIDETPSGILLHGIMSSIAEFYSRNLANEVIKGMTQKVKSGGVVSKVPLGYRNLGMVDDEGREIRTVVVDELRAPLITLAFKLYATGDWTVDGLAKHLARRGLTTLATPKVPSSPIDKGKLNKLLLNPFYKGCITFKGALYPGKHTPLVDEKTWQRVQDVLASHINGERTRVHPHFLKSTVYCGSCGSRLVITVSKSRSGIYYPYFSCNGRRRGNGCCQKSVLIEEVELQIEKLYDHISFTTKFRKRMETLLTNELKATQSDMDKEQDDYRLQQDKLNREREKLMQAHYADAISLDLLKSEQRRIDLSLLAIKCKFVAAKEHFGTIEDNLKLALDLAEDCGRAYREAPDHIKRLFNQAFFKRILVDDDCEVQGEFVPPFDVMFGPELRTAVCSPYRESNGKANGSVSTDESIHEFNHTLAKNTVSLATGLTKRLLVGDEGFEPTTLCV
jgi:site-specific DNA recombinase